MTKPDLETILDDLQYSFFDNEVCQYTIYKSDLINLMTLIWNKAIDECNKSNELDNDLNKLKIP